MKMKIPSIFENTLTIANGFVSVILINYEKGLDDTTFKLTKTSFFLNLFEGGRI